MCALLMVYCVVVLNFYCLGLLGFFLQIGVNGDCGFVYLFYVCKVGFGGIGCRIKNGELEVGVHIVKVKVFQCIGVFVVVEFIGWFFLVIVGVQVVWEVYVTAVLIFDSVVIVVVVYIQVGNVLVVVG